MQFIEALTQSDCDLYARLHAKLAGEDVQLVVNMAMEGMTMRLYLIGPNHDLLEMNFDELSKIEVTPKNLAYFMTRAMTSSKWEVY
jgi:Pyruvate/2-oxoacid:ferredoxin oxidoreductase gamma subunit